MGLFNMHYDRPGPGVSKDAPRKTGFARWFEIVARDIGSFTKANIITSLCFLPVLIIAFLAVIWLAADPNLLIVLLGVVLGSLLGAISGPALCAMEAIFLKALRDEPCFFWHTYKNAFRENFRRGCIVGAIFWFAMLIQLFAFILYLQGAASAVLLGMLFLDVLLITMAMIFLIPQMVLLALDMIHIMTTSLRLMLGYIPRSLPAALIQIVLFALQAIYAPTILPVFLLIGLWLPLFTGAFLTYKPLDQSFSIEEQFTQRRNQEMDEFMNQQK